MKSDFVHGEIREVTLISVQHVGDDATVEYAGKAGETYRGVIMGYVKLTTFAVGDPCLIRFAAPRSILGRMTIGGWVLHAIPAVDRKSEFIPESADNVEHQEVST